VGSQSSPQEERGEQADTRPGELACWESPQGARVDTQPGELACSGSPLEELAGTRPEELACLGGTRPEEMVLGILHRSRVAPGCGREEQVAGSRRIHHRIRIHLERRWQCQQRQQ